jgi:hypothetical protein
VPGAAEGAEVAVVEDEVTSLADAEVAGSPDDLHPASKNAAAAITITVRFTVLSLPWTNPGHLVRARNDRCRRGRKSRHR